MTLLRIVDRKTKDPIGVPASDEIEGCFTRVPAVASLVAVDELRTALAEKRPLLVGVADVHVTPVVERELEGQAAAELARAEPTLVPVVDSDPLALTASNLVARFDHADIVVRYADVLWPIYTEVPDYWCTVLDVAAPARLVVAFNVDDLCLGAALTQLVQPEGVFSYFSFKVVLPARVATMLRESMVVGDVPR